MTIMLKAESQNVAGIFLQKGMNNISDKEFHDIEIDKWGKILLANGIITVIELRAEAKSVHEKPKNPQKPQSKGKKGKK